MVYFTHARLMRESECSVRDYAELGQGSAQRACSLLVASRPRYATWISGHDRHMFKVARGGRRERQLTELRFVASVQIHRAALVRHLRDNEITGRERSELLAEFYGALDPDCAALAEHRAYTQAVSSRLCAEDLLRLADDRHGLKLLEAYEQEYGLYFAMHCDIARARRDGRPYLLKSLVPEIKAGVDVLRSRLLAGERLPGHRVLLPAPRTRLQPLPVADHPLERKARVAGR